jgi:hypothetical protein
MSDFSDNGSTGFRVDFTNVETKNFDPVPTGKYLLAVTDYEVKEIQSGENKGQPNVQFEFTIQQPEMIGQMKVAERKLWNSFFPTNPKTLWNLKGFMEALGDDVSGALNFNPDEIMQRDYESRLIVAKVKIQPARKDPNDPTKEYDARNQIGQFYPASTWKGVPGGTAVASSGSDSLLP